MTNWLLGIKEIIFETKNTMHSLNGKKDTAREPISELDG